MNLAENSNQAHLVGSVIFDGQFLVAPELFEDVVHFCESERRMKLLLALAVRINALGYLADVLSLCFAGVRKWERIEAHCFVISWPVFERSACRERPTNMNLARQDSKVECICARDIDEHVIWQGICIE